MARSLAIAITLLLGALVALQIPLNSQLGRHTGVLGAAFISTALTSLTLGVLVVVSGRATAVAAVREVPLLYAVGGGAIGVVLLSLTIVVLRKLGAGTMVAGFVTTQLIVSAAIDRLGLLGLPQTGPELVADRGVRAAHRWDAARHVALTADQCA